jgi:rhodanese-related sulfurtransferase
MIVVSLWDFEVDRKRDVGEVCRLRFVLISCRDASSPLFGGRKCPGVVLWAIRLRSAWHDRLLSRLLRLFRARGTGWIATAELQRRLASQNAPMVIDVRPLEEFSASPGHLPGAVNMPLANFASQVAELNIQRGPIALVCKTDRRSARAAETLHAAGLRDVVVLWGSTDGWHQQGLALE